jgi:hypothetical protein
MDPLKQAIKTATLSHFVPRFLDCVGSSFDDCSRREQLFAPKDWLDKVYTVIMTVVAFLLVLFVTSLAKPWHDSLSWTRRNAVENGNDSALEDVDVKESTSLSFTAIQQRWSRKLWADLNASPLTYFMTNNFDNSTNVTDAIDLDETPRPCHVLHFCFLLHGHRGLSQDLNYLTSQMRSAARAEYDKQGGSEQGTASDSLHVHDIVVHASVCNEKKTTDGVQCGGERVVEEILEVIRENVVKRQPLETDSVAFRDITISLVGNSLGGLYARYAIAKLTERWNRTANVGDSTAMHININNRTYRVHYNIFCTTATPHLGIAGHTFLPISRTAEIGVAHAMGTTGRDLFRLNDLLKNMATNREYLEPLSRFRKRIAYANAYGTDFPVPAHTAAFLSETSTYPHHFYDHDNDPDHEEIVVDDENGLVVATLHTPASSEYSSQSTIPADDNVVETWDDDSNDRSDLELMSTSLDSLGWKKVFIDVRKEIPRIALPTGFIRRRITQMKGTDANETTDVVDLPPPELLDLLRGRGVVGSKDIAAAMTTPLFDEQFHWPMGHNMMVAFSRSKWSSYLNKAGRPVVDALAKTLVEDIFAWLPAQIEPIVPTATDTSMPTAHDLHHHDTK